MAEKLQNVFKVSCCIRRNTQYVRDELEKIGYVYHKSMKSLEEDRYIYTNNKQGIYFTTQYCILNDDIYDCEKNIDLFLALAALREDCIDQYQYFKLPISNRVVKCECHSYIDMWGDFEPPAPYPKKMTMQELIKHFTRRDILVIYVDSREDTKDLSLVYDGLDALIMYNPKRHKVREMLAYGKFDTVIMMGHGTPAGLFNKSWDDYLIDESFADLLKEKKCIGIWCYASDFARKNDLKGFFTSMFISNSYEALSCGIDADDDEIQELTRKFCTDVNTLIKDVVPIDEWIEKLEANADMKNPIVKYNYEAMEYFD